MRTQKGIDISHHNGIIVKENGKNVYKCNIDFEKVKNAGIDFVIIRAGYGKLDTQKDKLFEQHYAAAKAAGLAVGAYWYSYCENIPEAAQEAEACLKVLKGKQFEFPIYFDVEEQRTFSKGKAFCSEAVVTFCNELEKNGYWAGLYISRSPLQTHITDRVAKRYALWIAEYSDKCKYSGTYGMWQHTAKGRVDGIKGDVDMDLCYIDYAKAIKLSYLNGFAKKMYRVTLGDYTEEEALKVYNSVKTVYPQARISEV